MYKEIIKTLNEQISNLAKQIRELQDYQKIKTDARKAIEKLQAEYEKENNNLAVQKGVCPFPDKCNLKDECIKNSCNADVCDNGHCYRMS